ncbi:hypothetical protein [Vulcanisaeta sp. JCM 14467]
MSFDKAGYLIGRNFVYPDYRPQFPRHYGYALRHLKAQVRIRTSDKSIEA